MNGSLVALFGLIGFAASASAIDAQPAPDIAPQNSHVERQARPRVCFGSAETREKIASRRLGEPFHLLRGVTGRAAGETLRAKLCRWNDDYIYDIAILRRDGRVVHVYLNAVNGQSVSADR